MNVRKMILIGTAALATVAATAATAAPMTNTNANGDKKANHSQMIRHHERSNAMSQQRSGSANTSYGSPDRW